MTRSRIPTGTASTSSRPFPPRTTLSPRKPTADSPTASATRAGPPTRRKSRSMSTALSTCRNRRCRRIPWRRRVRGLQRHDGIDEERNRADFFCGIVRRLSEALAQVRDEQSYIVVRERTHRNTAESTNGRVKWWSIFQLAVVIGEGIFQVWWLKRFFEVSLRQFNCVSVLFQDTYATVIL